MKTKIHIFNNVKLVLGAQVQNVESDYQNNK
jgi:hypothetical protein